MGRDLPYFEKNAGDDPEFMLLVVARQRDAMVSQPDAPKLKSRLLRERWRPNFFRNLP
jgi:hypothetical protein